MKQFYLSAWLVAALCVSPLSARPPADIVLVPPVIILPQADAEPLAVIDGPTVTPAGELVEFDAGGSTGSGYDWIVSGPSNTEGRWSVYEGGRILVFASPENGDYRITLSVALDGKSDLVEIVLRNGTESDDEDSDVDPPLLVDKWQVVIIYESNRLDNMTPDQQSIIKSLAFREQLSEAGHRIIPGGIWDRDTPDSAGGIPEVLAPYNSACGDEALPRICLSPMTGGKIRTFALPASTEAVMTLLEGVKP